MKNAGLILIALSLVLTSPGCAFRHKKSDAAQEPHPRLVGTVAYVNETAGFALVDVGSLYTPTPGKALKCFGEGQETAVLAVSPEHKRPFISADIVKGMPRQGDQVFE